MSLASSWAESLSRALGLGSKLSTQPEHPTAAGPNQGNHPDIRADVYESAAWTQNGEKGFLDGELEGSAQEIGEPLGRVIHRQRHFVSA